MGPYLFRRFILIFPTLFGIMLINFAIGNTEPTDSEFYSSDLNSDNVIDILDVVMLINIILRSII